MDEILEKSQSQPTKFFALQVLQPVIQYHWKALPRTQCDAIRTFIIDKLVKISSNEATLRAEKLYLQKLNETLVQVIFHPHLVIKQQNIDLLLRSSNKIGQETGQILYQKLFRLVKVMNHYARIIWLY